MKVNVHFIIGFAYAPLSYWQQSGQNKTNGNVWSVAWTRDRRITVDSPRYSALGSESRFCTYPPRTRRLPSIAATRTSCQPARRSVDCGYDSEFIHGLWLSCLYAIYDNNADCINV